MSDLGGTANPFAPPTAELREPPNGTDGPAFAGRGTRLVAVFIDGLLMMVAVAPLFFLGSTRAVFKVGNGAPEPSQIFGSLGIGYAAIAIVQGIFMYRGGQTLGKKLMGVRVVRSDGSRAGFVRLFFVRAGTAIGVAFIPLLGSLVSLVDSLLIFRDSRQCLHDQISDTIVVTAESSQDATLAGSRAARDATTWAATKIGDDPYR